MSEEKIFDVNWEGERNISENPQAFKMYSYPPGTIRNMSVPGFIIWLVLLLGSIGGFVYGAWMWITGDYENETVVSTLPLVCFVVFLGVTIHKSTYKQKLITYTDVLHVVFVDQARRAYVVHLNEDAFLNATGLSGYKIQQVQSQGVSMTHVGQSMDRMDMEVKAGKMIKRKDFLLKRIQEKPVFQEMMKDGSFAKVALPVEKVLKLKNPGGYFTVTYAYRWNGAEYTDKVRFYHSMKDYKELLAYFKERSKELS